MAKVNLKRGDSAVIIRHKNQGFDIEIYHKVDKKLLTEEDVMFYALLTRGMAYGAVNYTDDVLEDGKSSFAEDAKSRRITIH